MDHSDAHKFVATTLIPQYFYSVLDLAQSGDNRMTVVGFHFKKIHGEKKEPVSGKVDISNNISITDVKETDLTMGALKNKGLSFSFEFVSSYTPEVGNITLEGEILYVAEAKTQTDILKQWKKDKSTPTDVRSEIMSTILARSNVQALVMARDVNLPPPIPLPKIKK